MKAAVHPQRLIAVTLYLEPHEAGELSWLLACNRHSSIRQLIQGSKAPALEATDTVVHALDNLFDCLREALDNVPEFSSY